jgi:ABC-type nitrate/sulfonate/bicarbonate transport system permease component
MRGRKLGLLGLEIATTVAVLGAWYVLSAGSTSLYFPPLAAILESFRKVWIGQGFVDHVLPSLGRMLAGYLLAAVAGISVGLTIGVSSWARRLLGPGIDFLRALPAVVLVPFGLIVFGVGAPMQIFVIALGCSFPIILNTAAGAASVEPILHDVSRSFQFSRAERLFRVVLPAAAPSIFSGLRASLALALILMVVAEMVGSTDGIGYSILQSQRMFVITDMWAGLLMLGVVGYVVNLIFLGVEHFTLRWHHGLKASTRDA